MRATARVRAWVLLGICLSANVLHQRLNPPAGLDIVDLGTPPPATVVRLAALGESVFAGYLVTIFLQNVDVPLGRATSLAALDRPALIRWFDLTTDLDPGAGSPLLLATRHYAETGTPAQRRMMLDWVYRRFEERPNQRWPWLVHAVFVARWTFSCAPTSGKPRTHGQSWEAWSRQVRSVRRPNSNSWSPGCCLSRHHPRRPLRPRCPLRQRPASPLRPSNV
jgi:hypothetical protein